MTTARAEGLLLLAGVVWGAGFVAQKLGAEHLGPGYFNALRLGIGVLALAPVIVITRGRSSGSTSARAAAGLSVLFTLGTMLQQAGVGRTTTAKAGFLTGLYVLFVPLLGVVLGRGPRAAVWVGAGLAFLGLAIMSGVDLAASNAAGGATLNLGDAMILACAVCWAGHVVLTGHVAARSDALRLAVTQFAIAAVLCAAWGVAAGEAISPERIGSAAGPVLYSGVLAIAAGFTFQIIAQRHVPPAHAAVLFSLEAVFAAVFGWLILREGMSERDALGCGVMFAGVLVSQVRPRRGAPEPDSGAPPPIVSLPDAEAREDQTEDPIGIDPPREFSERIETDSQG
ncbi:MAG: DMT family transporter [Phycisphaeraceae bacterium]|nr:DMT family transporter [Phycisphaeraceae bacterium]